MGKRITWTEKPCKQCRRMMLPQLVWRNDPAAREGHVRHGAGDLCNACYGRDGRPARTQTGKQTATPSLAEQHGLVGDRHKAALAVCSMAVDRDEAALVLDMLGLLDAEPVHVSAAAGSGRFN